MSKKGSGKESKVSKFLKAPMRSLIKARDLYVKSMAEYSDRFSFGTVMGCPTAHINTLPRSYSCGSVGSTKSGNGGGHDDTRELIRAASTREHLSRRQKPATATTATATATARHYPPNANTNTTVPRSRSVAIGRIDEDKPCEFEGDHVIKVRRTNYVFPRSRSYAVSKTKKLGAFF